jgi:hypothetical protein
MRASVCDAKGRTAGHLPPIKSVVFTPIRGGATIA